MHGVIFMYLQRFTQQRIGADGWQALLEAAGLPKKSFSPVQEYPDTAILALVEAASTALKVPISAVLDEFGQFIAPELLQLYRTLIHPEWKTLEVIANTEELIHATVRRRNPGAKPPLLQCLRSAEDEIQIVYSSPRHLCALAKGIVQGLARHFGESVEITDESCMLHGDPFCSLHVRRLESSRPPAAETRASDSKLAATLSGMPLSGTAQHPAAGTARRGKYSWLSPPQGPDEIGRLTHYRVVRLLGSGGAGLVFEAEDTRLGRLVALKVLQPHLAADDNVHQRFVREAKAMAAVRSDHVATIYDVGVADHTPYLTMELLEGESLEAYVARQVTLPLQEVLRIAREIAAGLTAAHAKGFIHRDIKPSNLWVESPSGRIKILDFGLAKVGVDLTGLTQEGEMLGTPAFMAPEQANGLPVDPRADLFSLGAVLYWLASGRSPFLGKDMISTLLNLVSRDPPPIRDVNPELPPTLCDLIERLLKKDPAERLATSRQVVEALAALEREIKVSGSFS